MATEIYLGEPPQHIKEWIIAHSKPAANPKTKITFTDGTSQEYDWSGDINYKTMKDAGLLTGSDWKLLQKVEIGTNVTSVGDSAFYGCSTLVNVTIPDSVTRIGNLTFYNCYNLKDVIIPDSVMTIGGSAFAYCRKLTSVTFSGKDKATVQSMAIYPWDLPSGCVIHCTDGDITI